MASIIVSSSRILLQSSKALPKSLAEKKFYNSTDGERRHVLTTMSETPARISYTVSEKNDPADRVFVYGVDLYKRSLFDLIDSSLTLLSCSDVNILIDGNRYIQQGELRQMCETLCAVHGKNLKKCYKGISQNEPCLRLADYAVGAIRYSYEQTSDTYLSILENMVSVARRY